jgi:hypothetical protein
MGALRVDRGVVYPRDNFLVLFNHSLTIIFRQRMQPPSCAINSDMLLDFCLLSSFTPIVLY